IERLDTSAVEERLAYVAQALRLVRAELAGRTALIGFSGSPWTLANFMFEGGSAPEFTRARAVFESDRATYDALASRLTDAIIRYLNLQCDAGAEVIQVFDTLAGLLPPEQFEEASGRWLRDIVGALRSRVPVILFAKGRHDCLQTLVETGAQVLSVDASADLAVLRERLPARVGIQGNLDPEVLTSEPAVVRSRTRAILESMRGRAGHIFNLGHGVPPAAALENIETMIQTVRSFA